jgi:hypothetical protein
MPLLMSIRNDTHTHKKAPQLKQIMLCALTFLFRRRNIRQHTPTHIESSGEKILNGLATGNTFFTHIVRLSSSHSLAYGVQNSELEAFFGGFARKTECLAHERQLFKGQTPF